MKPIFKQNRVEQTINLKEEFGIDFSRKRSLREAIGGVILETIRNRTVRSVGMDFSMSDKGQKISPLKSYSDGYKESLDYKAFGKTGTVNLTLTGDMLGLMDIKRQSANEITIGWTDPTENAKAYNHSSPNRKNTTVPYRPFFGVSKDELKEIKRQFKDEIRAAKKDREGQKQFEQKLADLIDDLSGLIDPREGENEQG